MNKFKAEYILTMDDIVREGDPILREVTQPVHVPPSEEDRETLCCMLQFLKNSQDPELVEKYQLRGGVGLSANQIGLNKRMFAAYLQDEQGKTHEYMVVNPQIISHSAAMTYLDQGEGCLSVDRPVPGFVPRYERIKVKAYDINGEEVVLRLKGYVSIVFQHEMDHLNGIMFYDHIDKKNPYKLPDDVFIEPLWRS
ncbi:peptide deformylase [Paenibacillus larvae]|uniref:Peptide deformylase n=2 Tax=Paenibacillus larvae TaxID=1464 RepID=A0AAP5JTL0_9BACL|nr:peptide deformylase [Paenibacillus larvae]MDT2171004.1 peptide deformylase [Paenibacillus larvae]MDT2192763.1 peptide deformylase [Paenibacillus larvae]MDT2195993.1 peptide deformylase [Paenibacillus larvae]MDT2205405.1 peptide deformylase [Paenibacillus larvae]MDT2232253.1 peptide deformylase [Paenibacillus larvae]